MPNEATQDTYRSAHRQTLAESQQVDDQAQVEEPFFPDVATAVEANQAALAGHGQTNHALLRPEVLEGALGRAQNQYYYTGSMANAAAALAHGVGQAQAFEDGNKRTAYWLVHHFLRENGYGPETMPDDDVELADHLIGYGEGTHGLEDTANMFRGRGHIAKWKVVATQDEESWFEDYARGIIGSTLPDLPSHKIHIGKTIAGWEETQPGYAFIYANGGTVSDRIYACAYLREALSAHDIQRQQFTLYWDHSDERLIKEADWSDIEAKAKRLIQSGQVQILRNAPTVIVGQVQGDNGTYQTEIHRDDPNSQAISLWSCECEWDQFAWQRTRQWKKYEGRVCSHVLATYWLAQTMPLDEEQEPGGGEGGGAPQVPGEGGMVPAGMAPMITPGMAPQPPGTGNPVGTETAPGQAPELMPQYPMNPDMMPAINPVSVPGQKPQTPLNPIQNPGGTFSHTASYVNGNMVQLKEEDFGTTVGLNSGQQVPIPANSIGEVLGTDPTTGMVNVYFSGPQAEAGKLEPHGVTGWFFESELIARPDVRAPGPTIRRRS